MSRDGVASHILLTVEKRSKNMSKRHRIVSKLLEKVLDDKEDFSKKLPVKYKNSYKL